MPTPGTARELIEWGAGQLDKAGLAYGHGTDNAYDEAAALVLPALQLGLYPEAERLDAPVSADNIRKVTQLIELRISTRKPAAYLTGEAWFAGMPFYIDERALVPRSPLAELVENRFSPWVIPERVKRILDLCTGSGCIACACAAAFPDARIDAADLSADALAVAGRNIRRHALELRVEPVESDVFAGLGGRSYDIIVSNPPYVPHAAMSELPAEYHHEPAIGLVAGKHGLDIVLQILKNAQYYLNEGGILVVEVGYSQPLLESVFPGIPFTWLDFEYGGEGVFLLERSQLENYQPSFDQAVEQHTNT
jgi:ribosomal protein L3 glutamine methyltransferase